MRPFFLKGVEMVVEGGKINLKKYKSKVRSKHTNSLSFVALRPHHRGSKIHDQARKKSRTIKTKMMMKNLGVVSLVQQCH